MSEQLLPCPFCGAGTTEIRDNGKVWLGSRYSEPVSVSVRHWCEDGKVQPARMIERVGRDKASAIAAWNRRAGTRHAATVRPDHVELHGDIEIGTKLYTLGD